MFLFLTPITITYADNQDDLAKGKAVFEKACKICHAPPTAELMKAPTAHDEKAWQVKIDAANVVAKQAGGGKTSVDVMVETVKKGKGAMPPGGMCTNESKPCADEDYKAAIQFMSQQEK